VTREVAERIATGMLGAWRSRIAHLDGHVVVEHDGLVVLLSNLPDQDQSVVLVDREPADAVAALRRVEPWFRERDLALAVSVEAGRHVSVDAAIRTLGLSLAVGWPAMAARVADVAPPERPRGVELRRARAPDDLAAMAAIETAAFGTDPEVARRLFGPGALDRPGTTMVLATVDGEPAGMAYATAFGGTVGVFGVATLPGHRRRGIGTAITAFAIHEGAEGADLAWLQPNEEGRPVYERMGFETVADWQVWVRTDG
jgi:GNAT superfamily N-acetyltransferase